MAYTLYAEHNRVSVFGVRPGITGEQIRLDGIQVLAGTTVVYTVPAGKTLCVFNDWWVCEMGSVVGLDHAWGVFDALGVLVYRLAHMVNLGVTFSLGGSHDRFVPLEIGAGFSLKIVVVAGGTMSAGFEGLLVTPGEVA